MMHTRQGRMRPIGLLLTCLIGAVLNGCAALTNPVADGLPVRYLPPEVLGAPKSAYAAVPLALLEQKRDGDYRLDEGDVLGIWIEGVLGERTISPPIQASPRVMVRDQRRLPPAVGYPVPLRADGKIVLPMVPPISVRGLTLVEAEEAIREMYRQNDLLNAVNQHILVSLMQRRQCHVVVLRQEANAFAQGQGVGQFVSAKRGTGFSIDLPIGENDVLHALSVTGGLPGLDTFDEIIIQRQAFTNRAGEEAVRQKLEASGVPEGPPSAVCLRIPLHWKVGVKLPFRPDDVVLHDGDVVFLRARVEEVFFTGGLMPSGQHVLPRDRDLDVVEAVASVRGPLINGAFVNNNLAGNLINPGIGFDSPSLLVVVRRLPNGTQVPIRIDLNQALRDPRERIVVRPGDLLILQEMPNYALARYIGTTLLNFNMAWIPFRGANFIGVGDAWAFQQMPNAIGVGTYTTTNVSSVVP